MDTKEVLEKIKKLLALAQNEAATQGEAEAAIGRASHLQSTYGITDDAVRMHIEGSNPENFNIDYRAIKSKLMIRSDRIGRWDIWICQAASIASNCKSYRSHNEDLPGMVGYGLPVDLEVCYSFVTYLEQVSERLRKGFCVMNNVRYGSYDGKAWKDGFLQGVIESVKRDKIQQQEAKKSEVTQITSQTGALVVIPNASLVIARNRALAQYSKSIGLVSGAPINSKGGMAYNSGRIAGNQQKLNRNQLGG